MAKTIKQIADELGISKQAVFKRIDNLGLRSKLTKIDNQLMVEKEQENMIKSAFSEKQPSTKPSTKPSTSLQLETVNDAVVDVLLNQSEMLKNELKIKNKHCRIRKKREDCSPLFSFSVATKFTYLNYIMNFSKVNIRDLA